MHSLPANAALIVVDVQRAFDDSSWGQRNNMAAEANVAKLLAAWRAAHRPVFHVHHHSASTDGLFRPGLPGFAAKPEAEPLVSETLIYKRVNSAFIGTALEAMLREGKIDTLFIVGLTTDHCVSTTTRMAGNLGFVTYLVSDATATFSRQGIGGRHFSADEMHDTALASLSGEFATILDTAAVIKMHPAGEDVT